MSHEKNIPTTQYAKKAYTRFQSENGNKERKKTYQSPQSERS